MVDTCLHDPAIDRTSRTLMALAAHNAGPGNLACFCHWARKSSPNPNVWFYEVEEGAARIVGQETVTYVGNICKHAIPYRLLAEHQAEKQDAGAAASA